MPFLIYRRRADGTAVRYERLRAVALSGSAGPIARFVKTLPGEAAEEGWELEPRVLASLAGTAAEEGEVTVLFEVPAGDPRAVCLYELRRLCGVARDRRTQLSLDFEVLIDSVVGVPPEEFRRGFALPADRRGKRLREVLQLGGGPGGGEWRWETPAMNLGATLVSPTARSGDQP